MRERFVNVTVSLRRNDVTFVSNYTISVTAVNGLVPDSLTQPGDILAGALPKKRPYSRLNWEGLT
jgi:hypothetical protein